MNQSPNQNGGKKKTVLKYNSFPLNKINFILMAACIAMIVIGFTIMAIGPSSDELHFEEDIFSTMRLKVGPAIAFLGFCFMPIALMYRKKNNSNENNK